MEGEPFSLVRGLDDVETFASAENLLRAHVGARKVGEFSLRDFGRGEGGAVHVFSTLDEASVVEMRKRDDIKFVRKPAVRCLLFGSVDMLNQSTSVHPIESDTSPPFRHTNLVVFRRPGAIVIVDPGGRDLESLSQVVRSFDLEQRIHVLITHRHLDHWASLAHLETLVPENSILCGSKQCLDQVASGMERKYFSMECESALCGLRIIPTPGHTDGDLSVMDPASGIICVGDHCVGYGSSLLDANCGDMGEYISSCKKLIAIGPEFIIPAHGPLIDSPIDALNQFIAHRLTRERAILHCIREQGLTTPEEIVAVVYASTPKHLWPAAMSNIALHLRKIRQENLASL